MKRIPAILRFVASEVMVVVAAAFAYAMIFQSGDWLVGLSCVAGVLAGFHRFRGFNALADKKRKSGAS
jgi:hypothetical protein